MAKSKPFTLIYREERGDRVAFTALVGSDKLPVQCSPAQLGCYTTFRKVAAGQGVYFGWAPAEELDGKGRETWLAFVAKEVATARAAYHADKEEKAAAYQAARAAAAASKAT